jgi:hypothetical protein
MARAVHVRVVTVRRLVLDRIFVIAAVSDVFP